MLNISPTSIRQAFKGIDLNSLSRVEEKRSGKVVLKTISWLFLSSVLIMFMPWTQNIRSRGNVTTVRPDQRPQTIHSVIAGRIEHWHVKEGDFVRRGDTILRISEIKDDYFDPNLLARTKEQLNAKEKSVRSYMEKVRALDIQIDALSQTGELKLKQAENKLIQSHLKVKSDSMALVAAITSFEIAKEQSDRMEKLYQEGLKSLTELENRKRVTQQTNSGLISAENTLLRSRNEVINAKVELTSIQAQYRDAIAKAESEKYSAMSNMYDAEAMVTKLQNQFMNYSVRTGLYYITAPQDGYVTKAIQSGIGETMKEGAQIVSIMPASYDLAVAMYIKAIDLPLLQKGQLVRIQFDGWPAIVFSGWPNTSYGTYGGVVFAIDNFISENGMYRVLVAPDPDDHPWPKELRVGAGTKNMVLLNDVLIGYELWRKINGFPPEYYGKTQLH